MSALILAVSMRDFMSGDFPVNGCHFFIAFVLAYSINFVASGLSVMAKNESVNIPCFSSDSIILLLTSRDIPLIWGLFTSGLGIFHFESELIIGASNSVHVGNQSFGT